jgi:two-component system, NarL family, response regulator DevR
VHNRKAGRLVANPNTSRSSADPIRVFVINDSQVFVDALGRFLDDEPDIQLVGAEVGLLEALPAVASARPELVLIDPEPHDRVIGKAVRELRARLPRVGIIVLTLHMDIKHRDVAIAAGADAFVDKYAASADLLAAIRRIAGQYAAAAGDGLRPPAASDGN